MSPTRRTGFCAWVLAVIMLLGIGLLAVGTQGRAAAAPTYTLHFVQQSGTDSGTCSLLSPCKTIRYALTQVADGDKIQVGTGTFTENLTISRNVTIEGVSAAATIIDGGILQRTITVTAVATATIGTLTVRRGVDDGFGGGGIINSGGLILSGVVITGGHSSTAGGGIYNQGVLTMTNCLIEHNTANNGGGVNNMGNLSIQGSTIADNTAVTRGGGLWNINVLAVSSGTVVARNSAPNGGGIANMGVMTLTQMALSSNHATASGDVARGGGLYNASIATLARVEVSSNDAGTFGGGLFNDSEASASLVNVTLYGNSAPSGGGGIMSNGATALQISFSTLSGNSSNATLGGGLVVLSSGANVKNSIFANNPGGNCPSFVHSDGYNLEDANTCHFAASTDMTNTVPLLGNLTLNAPGSNQTMAIGPGSPAFNRIPGAACTDYAGAAVTTDQRGAPRPMGSGCEIGAFEYSRFLYLPLIFKGT